MTSKWTRLGQKLRAARIARGVEQQDAAERIGVKRGALHNIETGKIAKVTTTVRTYAQLVGWADGSIEAVLDGGEPIEKSTSPETVRELPSDLSVHVQQSLSEGPLLDARVAEVSTPNGRVKATIVIRGEGGTSTEDLLAALRMLTIDVKMDD
ncbi:helix-turn-helix domain-containing protein [Streptomyces murinus]|uniref:helix-turn-helix domain-containing protein n=1 Tax=Streptomyces murinus TaxID=33900 RepID=UPI0018F5880D|nr:helix-turn-helix transcriptional regulator [Streptomyces murinus]